MSRRYHTKSRNSCGACKKRRVKCDLQAPICSHCKRRKEHCDFQDLNSPDSLPESAYSPKAHPSRLDFHSDEYLLAHYSTSTASTLPLIDDFIPIWKDEVTPLAKVHTFLHHSLLSISALHLGYLSPSIKAGEEYTTRARTHYLEATRLFRQNVTDVEEENYLAIFAFSIMGGMFYFRTSKAEDYMTPLLAMRSAVGLIRHGLAAFLTRGSMALLRERVLESTPRIETDDSLVQEINTMGIEILDIENGRDGKLYTCTAALGLLQDCIKLFGTRPRSWDHIAWWSFRLNEEFLDILDRRDTLALGVFRCWCLFVRNAPVRWFWDGWADGVIRYIEGMEKKET